MGSKRALKVAAALVWYTGGILLASKAALLLQEAESLRPGWQWPVFSVVTGLAIGMVKETLIFRRACRRNLARIDALERPRVWSFFRPWFFFFLFLMIATGATLSRLAHGDFPLLIAVATLDLTIATALLASSTVFWSERFLSKR